MDPTFVAPFESELANSIAALIPALLSALLSALLTWVCEAMLAIASLTTTYGSWAASSLLAAAVSALVWLALLALSLVVSALQVLLAGLLAPFLRWPVPALSLLGIAALAHAATSPRARSAARSSLLSPIQHRVAWRLVYWQAETCILLDEGRRILSDARAREVETLSTTTTTTTSPTQQQQQQQQPAPPAPAPLTRHHHHHHRPAAARPTPPRPRSPPSPPPSHSLADLLRAVEAYDWHTKTGRYAAWAATYRPEAQRFPHVPAPRTPSPSPPPPPPHTSSSSSTRSASSRPDTRSGTRLSVVVVFLPLPLPSRCCCRRLVRGSSSSSNISSRLSVAAPPRFRRWSSRSRRLLSPRSRRSRPRRPVQVRPSSSLVVRVLVLVLVLLAALVRLRSRPVAARRRLLLRRARRLRAWRLRVRGRTCGPVRGRLLMAGRMMSRSMVWPRRAGRREGLGVDFCFCCVLLLGVWLLGGGRVLYQGLFDTAWGVGVVGVKVLFGFFFSSLFFGHLHQQKCLLNQAGMAGESKRGKSAFVFSSCVYISGRVLSIRARAVPYHPASSTNRPTPKRLLRMASRPMTLPPSKLKSTNCSIRKQQQTVARPDV